MRKLAALAGTAALSAGLLLGASGVALADTSDDHSVSDDHADYSRHHTPSHCSDRHSLNVSCNDIHLIDLGNIF